jgi:hypothetical protein
MHPTDNLLPLLQQLAYLGQVPDYLGNQHQQRQRPQLLLVSLAPQLKPLSNLDYLVVSLRSRILVFSGVHRMRSNSSSNPRKH